jgi:hypothetical protein
MGLLGTRSTLPVIVVVMVAAAAAAQAQDVVVTGTPTTVITTASGLIGQVSDLLVAADGRVYAADGQANLIHVVDAAGHVLDPIGREGQGPGELLRPTGLAQKGDTLVVVDWLNYRVQYMSLDGEPLRTERIARGPTPPVVGPSGLMVSPTLGFAGDTALAIIRGADYSEGPRIGRTAGVTPNPVRISALRDEVRDGRVPVIFLNSADATVSAGDIVWLTVPARGSIEQYDATGRRLSSLQLEDPAFDAVRRKFVDDNAAATGMNAFDLRHILDTRAVGEDLWVLLGQSMTSPAVLRVVNQNGALGPRYVFPNVSEVDQFAVDVQRRLIYFVRPDTAELLRVSF